MDIKDSYLHGTVGVVKSISVDADKLSYKLADVNNTTKTITLPLVTQSANGLMSKEDKTKLDLSTGMTQAIPYIVGHSTDTTAGTWTGSYAGITSYTEGLTIIYVPSVAGASTTTLNINGLGAITCYYNNSKLTTHYSVGTPIMLTYVGGYWRRADYNANTYPSAYCITSAKTAAKTATCSDYTLTENSYIHVLIVYANTSLTALTLNINSKGAKPIYINGAASSSSNYTLPAGTYIAYYDGTNFYFRTDGVLPGTIEKASSATSSDKVKSNLILKINSGTTEGTSLYTYNGSSAKTLDIKNGTGIGFTNNAGVLSIYNSGVRSISTGTANGTISVNTNGASTDVAVKGLGSSAYLSTSVLANYTKGTNYIAFNLYDSSLHSLGLGNGYIEYYDNDAWYNSKWGWIEAVNGFKGNLDGTYINKLTGYSKASAIGSIAATDSLKTALGKLEFKTDFIYNDLFGTDNDNVINKWHEIVDFIDSVAGGTSSQFVKGNGSLDSNKYLINTHATHTSAYYRTTNVNDTNYAFWSHTSGTSFTIYAPTSAGTSGQVLISSSGTPSWTNQSNLSVGTATKATYLLITTGLTTETDINLTGLRFYSGTGYGWTGSISSMAYAGIIALGTPSRGFQMWARRGTGKTGSLHFRVGNDAADAWETERTILDNANWTSFISIPKALKNPNSLTIFGVSYDGSSAKTITAATMIGTLSEGTSNVTDNTEILTSYASNNGFADTNAPNVVYKRDAICVYNYIKSKLDSVYQPKGSYLTSLGYIGTTSVQSSSAAQALTGITSATISGVTSTDTLTISNTSGTGHINFSRGSYNYITMPSGGLLHILPNGAGVSASNGMVFSSNGLHPASNAAYSLGTSSLKWDTVYANTFNGNASSASNLKNNSSGAVDSISFYRASSVSETLAASPSYCKPANVDSNGNTMILRMRWSSGAYGHDIYAGPNEFELWHRNTKNSTEVWRKFIDSGNIGSQSVSYATSSGNSDTVDNYHISVGSSAGTATNTIYFVI